MGIKNLKNILIAKCSSAIVQRKLNSYNGMIIGVDLSIFLYKYLYRNDDHIEGLTRFILKLLKNNIYPVFVFDGKPPKEKGETLQERKQKREFLFMKKEIIELIRDNDKDDKIVLLYTNKPEEQYGFVKKANDRGYDVLHL